MTESPDAPLYLVSCVSKKRDTPTTARALYVSDWFIKARTYVEATCSPWFILSAEYGLLHPDAVVAPYERTLNRMSAAERRAWAGRVLASLAPVAARRRVIVLAGERYREHLVPALRAQGSIVEIPLEGLKIGEQLHWFVLQRGTP